VVAISQGFEGITNTLIPFRLLRWPAQAREGNCRWLHIWPASWSGIFVHPLVLEFTGRKSPKDGFEAKSSLYHGAACGLLYGKATPYQYTNATVRETSASREKITATVDDSIRAHECRIQVQTEAGKFAQRVARAIGSLLSPLTLD
jgi:aconitate decarboxylase